MGKFVDAGQVLEAVTENAVGTVAAVEATQGDISEKLDSLYEAISDLMVRLEKLENHLDTDVPQAEDVEFAKESRIDDLDERVHDLEIAVSAIEANLV